MQYIKTPTGIIPIDDPVKVVTQEKYDSLSQSEKNTGTYYITDDDIDDRTMLSIIGTRDIPSIGIGDNITDGLYTLSKNYDDIKNDSLNAHVDITSSNTVPSSAGTTSGTCWWLDINNTKINNLLLDAVSSGALLQFSILTSSGALYKPVELSQSMSDVCKNSSVICASYINTNGKFTIYVSDALKKSYIDGGYILRIYIFKSTGVVQVSVQDKSLIINY